MWRISSVTLIVLVLLAILPPTAASSDQVIQVIAGDYSDGSVVVLNPHRVNYKLASVREVWVESPDGRRVEGFNVTISPRVVQDWGLGEGMTFRYNVSCAPTVAPGGYSLKIRFLGVLPTGELSIFIVSVPLTVLESPLHFGDVNVYTLTGSWPRVFIGGELVVYSSVYNMGHVAVNGTAFLTISRGGKTYVSLSKAIVFEPASDSTVLFNVKLPYSLGQGDYTLKYVIKTPRGTFSKTLTFSLEWGVSLLGVSLEKDRVYVGDSAVAYVSVMSQRNIPANLTVRFINDKGEHVDTLLKQLSLGEGSFVFEVPLFTEAPGRYNISISIGVGENVIGTASATYEVVEAPRISSVVPVYSEENLEFRVMISNPGAAASGVISYLLRFENGTVYKGSKVIDVPSGNSTVVFVFPSGAGDVEYTFNLSVGGRVSSASGTFEQPSPPTPGPAPTNTSTTPVENTTSSYTPSNSTGAPTSGGLWWLFAVLLITALVVSGAYCIHRNQAGRKRRGKRGPKRRSPLGRFRRPRPPTFWERDSLPKKK